MRDFDSISFFVSFLRTPPSSTVNERNSTEFCRRFGSEPDYTAAALLVPVKCHTNLSHSILLAVAPDRIQFYIVSR